MGDDRDLDEGELTDRVRAQAQLPDRVELIDEVPRTTVGKSDKKLLRARFSA